MHSRAQPLRPLRRLHRQAPRGLRLALLLSATSLVPFLCVASPSSVARSSDATSVSSVCIALAAEPLFLRAVRWYCLALSVRKPERLLVLWGCI